MDRNTFPNRSQAPLERTVPTVLYSSSRRTRVGAIAALCALLAHCGPSSWVGGVHAVFGWSPEGVRVADVPQDGPAAEAGLAPGDRLLAIDGREVAGLSKEQVHELLTGEVGSEVVLEVERAGERREVRIARAPYRPRIK